MSNIKFSNNAFIGRYELEQMQSFVQDEGYQKYIKDNAISFGLIDNSINGNFINARITEGVGDNTIVHASILGINNDGKFIAKDASEDITVTGTNWQWIKLTRSESNLEQGTITISANGVITGLNANFLTTLRGKVTDFPTKLTFPSSILNTSEYEVLSVTDDDTAQLNVVSMSAESDQDWQIIPTNTPSSILTTDEKKLFNYDSATITLVAESALTDEDDVALDGSGDTLPKAVAGEYWLARIQNSGTDVIIQDKRSNYIYKTVDGYFTSYLDKTPNVLIGVEAIKYQATTEPRSKNIVEVAFAMRSSAWTSNVNANRVSFTGGIGGTFKATSDFTTGDFDGWRLYFESGKYAIVKQSTLNGSQIDMILDSLDPAELIDTAQQLLVTPDCSEIELFFVPDTTTPLNEIKVTYPINTDLVRVELPVTASTANYTVKYRHKHLKDYGAILTLATDLVGYYAENQFEANGSLIVSPTRTSYTSGVITLTENSLSYNNRLDNVETGDRFGVTTTTLDAATENNQLIVGANTKEQIYTGAITLTDNKYINLKNTGAVAGNQFFLQFEADVTKSGFEFAVVYNWDGTSSPANILLDFDDFYLAQSATDNLLIRCTFNGTIWKSDVLTSEESVEYVDASDVSTFRKYKTKTIEIGDWDMNATSFIIKSPSVADWKTIRSVSVIVRNDTDTERYPIPFGRGAGVGAENDGYFNIGSTGIAVFRITGTTFDSTDFDSTSYNRGWVTITYES
jgi:hypothetical protein